MRRLVYACIVVAVAIFFTHTLFAEERPMAKESMMPKMMQPGQHKLGGAENMRDMMMKKMMMEEQLVATQDGGVVVLFGNKLIKYDKDLNLVKEAELKIDMEAMMKCMKEYYDTMGKRMKESETK
jgi:hypothetical protein